MSIAIDAVPFSLRPSADGRRSSACGWQEVVCLRTARGRLLADGPWLKKKGRLHADGPEVVCMRMARRSSACGRPVVVCLRMIRGHRLRMAGGRLRMAGGRLRMVGEVVCGWPERSSADGPGSSADGDSSSRMVNVVKWCDRGQRWPGVDPLVGCSTLVRGSSVSVGLPTTLASIALLQKKKKRDVRRRGRWAGARACTNALFSVDTFQ